MFTTVVVVIFRHVVEIVDLIVCDISQPAASFPSSIVLLHTGRRKKWWNGGARSREKGSNGSWHGKKVHQHYASCQANAGVEFHIIGASSLWETKSYTNALLHQLYGASKRVKKINSQDSLQRLHLSTGLGTLQCPRMSWKRWFGWGKSGLLCSDGCPHDPNPDKEQKKDGWILRWIQSTSFLFTLEVTTQIKSLSSYIFLRPMKLSLCVCTSIEQAAGTLNKGPRHPFFCKLWTTCNLQELNQRYFTNEFLQSQRNWIPFLVSKLFSWQDKGTC